jgi:prevent-host-death family protein
VKVTVHQAKTHLSRILRRVEAGEEVLILRGREPVAKVVPLRKALRRSPRKRKLGLDRGKVWIAEDFGAPLPDDILAQFEGP